MASGINAGDTVTIICHGTIPGPVFLDGRTGNGTVGLAPSTDAPFTGTRWRVLDDGAGNLLLRCMGDVDGPRFLDGRTADGTVGLAASTDPPFTGTHWATDSLADSTFALRCLGNIDGPRMLDGRTGDGSVGLAPVTDLPFSGTHWSADPIGLPGSVDFDFPSIVFDGGVPVGGWAHLTLSADGTYVFSGHFHDSGATEYDMAAVIAVKDSAGMAYTIEHQGHVSGTFESGSRDDDWSDSGTNPQIAAHWADIAFGSRAVLKSDANSDLVNLMNLALGVLGTVLGIIGIAAAA